MEDYAKINQLLDDYQSNILKISPSESATTLAHIYSLIVEYNDSPEKGAILVRMASVYIVIANYRKALQIADEALYIFTKLNDKLQLALCYGLIGNVCSTMGEFDKALNAFNKMVEYGLQLNNMQIIANGLSNIGTINSYRGNYDLALESYQRALDLFVKYDDPHSVSVTYNNIGSALQHKGDYATAKNYYEKSLKSLGQDGEDKFVGAILHNIGQLYAFTKEYGKSFEYLYRSIQVKKIVHDLSGLANTYGVLATIHFDLNEFEKAMQDLQESMAIQEQIGDKYGLFQNTKLLIALVDKLQDNVLMVKYLEYAIQLATELGIDDERRSLSDRRNKLVHFGHGA